MVAERFPAHVAAFLGVSYIFDSKRLHSRDLRGSRPASGFFVRQRQQHVTPVGHLHLGEVPLLFFYKQAMYFLHKNTLLVQVPLVYFNHKAVVWFSLRDIFENTWILTFLH